MEPNKAPSFAVSRRLRFFGGDPKIEGGKHTNVNVNKFKTKDNDVGDDEKNGSLITVDDKEQLVTFPMKLLQILESQQFEDSLRWNQEGDGIWIVPSKFTERVLKQHFQGSKFTSFTRKLNRWGFRRIIDGTFSPNAVLYGHELFVRSHPDAIRKMRIIKSKEKVSVLTNATRFLERSKSQGFERAEASSSAHAGQDSESLLRKQSAATRPLKIDEPNHSRHQPLKVDSSTDNQTMMNQLLDQQVISPAYVATRYQCANHGLIPNELWSSVHQFDPLNFSPLANSADANESFLGGSPPRLPHLSSIQATASALAAHQLSQLQEQNEAILSMTEYRIKMLSQETPRVVGVSPNFSLAPKPSLFGNLAALLKHTSRKHFPPGL